jgi:hypothetical protein
VKNGLRLDEAFLLNPLSARAFAIMFSEMEGHKFDLDRMDFVKPPAGE